VTVSGGDLTTQAGGAITMSSASDSVYVAGSANFGGASENAKLTAGKLVIAGNFTQSGPDGDEFDATGSHSTIFVGGTQHISFANTSRSMFNRLKFTTSGTKTFSSGAQIGDSLIVTGGSTLSASGSNRLIVAGAVSTDAIADLGGVDTLLVTGATFPIYNNTTDGKAPKMTELTGSVALANATQTVAGALTVASNLDLNGKTLIVKDSVVVAGNLKFQSATPTNLLTVGKMFKIGGNGNVIAQAGAGTLEVAGDFNESSSATTPFQAASGFLTKLDGTGAQSVSFMHASASNSYLNNLTIGNTGSGVNFATNGFVKGNLVVSGNATLSSSSGTSIRVDGTVTSNSGSQMSGVTELIVTGSSFPTFGGSSTPAKTTLTSSSFVRMNADATLTGALDLQGDLSLEGHKLFVGGDLTVESSGILNVARTTDSVVVGGNALFQGDQSDFPFTAGAFDIGGNFTATTSNAFYMGTGSSTNTARFTGSGLQNITISGTGNSFRNISVKNSSSSGVVFTTSGGASSLELLSNAFITVNTGVSFDPLQLALHSGSKVQLNGTGILGNSDTGCQAHDPNFSGGGGATPTISGTGRFLTLSLSGALDVSSLFNLCAPSNLNP
jgi:hypothetical protein